jgi:hypothetical protein
MHFTFTLKKGTKMTTASDYREEPVEMHTANTIVFILICILAFGMIVGVWFGGMCLINTYSTAFREQINLIKNIFM